jgi:hypothetical protein
MSAARSVFASIVLVAAALAGCGPAPEAAIPEGFAQVEAGDEFAFRTANADGVIVAVRAVDNEPRGDLTFWSSTLARRLVRRGYEPEGAARRVVSRDGAKGMLRTFRATAGGRDHLYWLGVYVAGDDVFVLEATGDAEVLDAAMRARVEATIASVDLDA